jgi:hypothetical protein
MPRGAASRLAASPRPPHLFLAVVTAIALIAPAAADFVIANVMGTYNRYVAFPGSESLCPLQMTFGAPKLDPSDSSGKTGTLSDAAIQHDGKACTSGGEMFIQPLPKALDNPAVAALYARDKTGLVEESLQNIEKATNSILGFEATARVCGATISLPAATTLTFVYEKDRDIEVIKGVTKLAAGARHISLFSFTDKDAYVGCLYSDKAPLSTSDSVAQTLPPPTGNSTTHHAEAANGKGKSKTSNGGAGGGPACFPAHARVLLASGAFVRMDALRISDVVAVSGSDDGTEVYAFTHADRVARTRFVSVLTSSGAELALSRGHYLHVDGALAAAATLRVGDTLELADGSADTVVGVRYVWADGLYAPQTISGELVVDGVRVSAYTTAVEPQFAHAALTPLRWAYSRLGVVLLELTTGAPRIAELLPNGFSTDA